MTITATALRISAPHDDFHLTTIPDMSSALPPWADENDRLALTRLLAVRGWRENPLILTRRGRPTVCLGGNELPLTIGLLDEVLDLAGVHGADVRRLRRLLMDYSDRLPIASWERVRTQQCVIPGANGKPMLLTDWGFDPRHGFTLMPAVVADPAGVWLPHERAVPTDAAVAEAAALLTNTVGGVNAIATLLSLHTMDAAPRRAVFTIEERQAPANGVYRATYWFEMVAKVALGEAYMWRELRKTGDLGKDLARVDRAGQRCVTFVSPRTSWDAGLLSHVVERPTVRVETSHTFEEQGPTPLLMLVLQGPTATPEFPGRVLLIEDAKVFGDQEVPAIRAAVGVLLAHWDASGRPSGSANPNRWSCTFREWVLLTSGILEAAGILGWGEDVDAVDDLLARYQAGK